MDAESNRYSIFNVILEMSPAALPLVMQRVTLNLFVWRTMSDPEIVEGNLSVFNNEDSVLPEFPVKIDFNGKSLKVLRISINGIPIHAPGVLAFKYRSEEVNKTLEVPVLDPPSE